MLKNEKNSKLVETFGIVYALQAADAMCKAADVTLSGFENVASGYISILVTGDVGLVDRLWKQGCRLWLIYGNRKYTGFNRNT